MKPTSHLLFVSLVIYLRFVSATVVNVPQGKVTLASLIGDEEVIPKELIRKIEEFLAPALTISTNEKCKNHSEVYINGLRNRETWAYQILDSSAKLQPGIMTGNLVSIGNFDECIGVTDIETEFGSFGGKHCLATLTWQNESFSSTSKLFNKLNMPGMTTSLTVRWGFCIPSSCNATDLEEGLRSLLYRDIRVYVDDIDCHTNDARPLKTMDYIAIVIFAVVGLLVILSTSYDLSKDGSKQDILIAFSLYTNGKKLLKTKNTSDNLPSLHGMRFLSICWIVLGHRYMISTEGPTINLTFALDFIKGTESVLVINSQLGVDTFLVMSGFLVSYVFLKQMSKNKDKSFNIFVYYLHRYIRLTPVLAVMVLLQLSLINHLGSGPLWDKTDDFLTQLCKENWWSALLYVQNYVSGDRMCVGHSWYLSVDMQLIWISPLLLLPLLKWQKKWNLALLGSIVLAGILTSFSVTYVNEFPAGVRAGVGPKWNARDKYEYVKTHTRFTPWIIGFGLGYLVFENRNRKVQLSKLYVTCGWLMAFTCLGGAIYGILPFQQPDYIYNAAESASYSSLYRSVWAVGVSWIIFACVSGYGGPVNTFLSWKAFQPFSRLTYSIYLVHFTFIMYRQLATRVPSYLNDMNVVTLYFGDMAFSIMLAAILFLAIETPAMVIENALRKRGKTKSKKCVDVSKDKQDSTRCVEGGSINNGFSTNIRELRIDQNMFNEVR